MGPRFSGYAATYKAPHTSMFLAPSAFCSMNARLGSTSSPINLVKIWSAAIMSSICTFSSRRTDASIVVSHSWLAFISPNPL